MYPFRRVGSALADHSIFFVSFVLFVVILVAALGSGLSAPADHSLTNATSHTQMVRQGGPYPPQCPFRALNGHTPVCPFGALLRHS